MVMCVLFQTRAVSGRPITTDWAIRPIRVEEALGKEGFRETESDACKPIAGDFQNN